MLWIGAWLSIIIIFLLLKNKNINGCRNYYYIAYLMMGDATSLCQPVPETDKVHAIILLLLLVLVVYHILLSIVVEWLGR